MRQLIDCPDCGGTGRTADIPWSEYRGRMERNPEHEVDGPCHRCRESGQVWAWVVDGLADQDVFADRQPQVREESDAA